jgi:hypothetical protein
MDTGEQGLSEAVSVIWMQFLQFVVEHFFDRGGEPSLVMG